MFILFSNLENFVHEVSNKDEKLYHSTPIKSRKPYYTFIQTVKLKSTIYLKYTIYNKKSILWSYFLLYFLSLNVSRI